MNKFNENLFVMLLTFGIGFSLIARIFSDDFLDGSNIAIIICFFCLVAYYYMISRDNTGLHNPDNLYYMGLLFTLATLVYSLVTLFLLKNNEGDITLRTNNLIGSFGIALISTFLGILFRILLLQKLDEENPPPRPGPKPEQQGQFAHQSLTEAAFKLRQELTQTIADMSVFRLAIVQATNETVQGSDKAHAAMLQQVEKAAHEQTRILSTYDSLNSGLRQSATLFASIGSEIEQAAETLAIATKAFSKSLAEATEITPQYTQQFEQLITTLRQEATQWQSMTQEVRSSLVQAIKKLTETVKRS